MDETTQNVQYVSGAPLGPGFIAPCLHPSHAGKTCSATAGHGPEPTSEHEGRNLPQEGPWATVTTNV